MRNQTKTTTRVRENFPTPIFILFSLSLSLFAGDNMLTALSVARECGMVESKAKVVVINAETDNSGRDSKPSRKPSITFSLANKQVGYAFLNLHW
jgi:hypothetical protein